MAEPAEEAAGAWSTARRPLTPAMRLLLPAAPSAEGQLLVGCAWLAGAAGLLLLVGLWPPAWPWVLGGWTVLAVFGGGALLLAVREADGADQQRAAGTYLEIAGSVGLEVERDDEDSTTYRLTSGLCAFGLAEAAFRHLGDRLGARRAGSEMIRLWSARRTTYTAEATVVCLEHMGQLLEVRDRAGCTVYLDRAYAAHLADLGDPDERAVAAAYLAGGLAALAPGPARGDAWLVEAKDVRCAACGRWSGAARRTCKGCRRPLAGPGAGVSA
jgi:hypothetical protein